MPMTIVPIAPEHRAAWDILYRGYAEFYRVAQTAEMRDRVWGWLMDETHDLAGFVALDAGHRPVGLTHFRPFTRPLMASTGGFLDDLFVAEDARGSGAAEALIAAVVAVAKERGWTIVRWITAEDNARARKVYDKLATRTAWVTYDIKPS
jgi:GNAT superfamily N-acetyltransferase